MAVAIAESKKLQQSNSNFQHTECTIHLTNEQKKTYEHKITKFNITHPYQIPQSLFSPMKDSVVPNLSYADIFNYLIKFQSQYTPDSLKAYKSLDAYKYLTSGWALNPLVWQLPQKKLFIITAKVSIWLNGPINLDPVDSLDYVTMSQMMICPRSFNPLSAIGYYSHQIP